ncbi:hypothetical protein [Nocardioides sp. Kera G14]|uniref:hypothetical protein n=1 Tax=Nocardioides sp. Kera G14 TaxID=2884264 RepID=UPI001D11A893|nr:hypothetical protein [Nocardioides sp. Kera G14]UDY22574.1 hypothetical protein LH076_10855 [Nocardioides sp. Kera G14]
MPALPRRALPGLAGVVALTAACDPFDSSAPSPTGPTKDELLVAQITAAVGQMRELAVAKHLPALAAMHEAHLGVLAPPVTASSSTTPSGAAAPATSAAPAAPPPTDVRAGEEALKSTLAAGAAAAESGALARALASMSAAVAQQLVVLA